MAADALHGRFMWYDLMTTDPAAAQSFYSELIGWGTQQWEGGTMPYTMWTNQGTPMGGLMELPEDARKQGAPPHWLAYIAAADLEATANRAQELGARVYVPPTEIPDAGAFAVLADPQGATFAVYSSPQEPGPERPAEAGEVSWHELATTDHEGAFGFYRELFGWSETDRMDMGEAGIYQMFGRGQGALGGMFNKPAEMPGPPFWLYYIKVDDVDKAVERVKQLGGQVLNGPMDVPGGDRVVQCMDPQGAAFALHSAGSGSA
jgi:predicted enzyme related to lactoylglutathione lyase